MADESMAQVGGPQPAMKPSRHHGNRAMSWTTMLVGRETTNGTRDGWDGSTNSPQNFKNVYIKMFLRCMFYTFTLY